MEFLDIILWASITFMIIRLFYAFQTTTSPPRSSLAEPQLDVDQTIKSIINYSPEEAKSISLKVHDISVDEMHDLAEALGTRRNVIRQLSLLGNSVGDLGSGLIIDLFRDSSQLEGLDLGNCFISDIGASNIASSMPFNLKTLLLSHNAIKGNGANAIFNNAVCGSMISKLSLANNQIDDSAIQSLCSILRSEPNALTSLDLSGNVIGNAGAKAIADLLVSEEPGEGKRTLSHSFSMQSHHGSIDSVSSPKSVGCKLQSIDLSWNLIGSEGLIAIGEALAKNSTLFRLIVASNDQADGAVSVGGITTGLSGNITLRHLDLSGIRFGDEKGELLSKALLGHCALEHVSLQGCELGKESAIQLGKVLSHQDCILKTVDLDFNEFGDGIDSIIEGLWCSSTIVKLEIGGATDAQSNEIEILVNANLHELDHNELKKVKEQDPDTWSNGFDFVQTLTIKY